MGFNLAVNVNGAVERYKKFDPNDWIPMHQTRDLQGRFLVFFSLHTRKNCIF